MYFDIILPYTVHKEEEGKEIIPYRPPLPSQGITV